MSDKQKQVTTKSRDVAAFLEKVSRTPVKKGADAEGRLLFAMDATASRQMTWDRACHLQGQMFESTRGIGNLSVQLCYYRGFNEFHAGPWCLSADLLLREMSSVKCLGGYTQINRVLEHAMAEHRRNRLKALVFVGDALEEASDRLCHLAGQLGVLGVPLFMFQEGQEPTVRSVFSQMAQLSNGAYAPFDLNSASELKDLLSAVAVFAAGGASALSRLTTKSGSPAALLTHQLKNRE